MTGLRTPVKYAATINRTVLAESTSADHQFKYIDISSVDSTGAITVPDEWTRFGAAPSRARRVAPPGTTVVSTVRTYLRAVAAVPSSEDPLVFSTGFATLEATHGTDSRFLGYACRSDEFIDEVVARSSGVSYPAINPSDLGQVVIPLPPVDEQRRIADFLDDQTARIDRIIVARRDQAALIEAAVRSEAAHHYDREPRIPLRHLVAEARVGIVVRPSDYYTEGENGVPALRGIDVQPFEVSGDDLVKITPEGDALNARSRLRADDVVLVRTGDAGAASRVPSWAAGYNAIDLVILRAGPSASPDYLEFVINAARWGAHIDAAAAGSIQQHFGVNAALGLRVPFLDKQDQARIAADFAAFRALALEGQRALHNSIDLLQEFKGSLISAAVSGEFDVSAASGRGVPA